jgi:hypothetical protein
MCSRDAGGALKVVVARVMAQAGDMEEQLARTRKEPAGAWP